jgi:hypothetical protein
LQQCYTSVFSFLLLEKMYSTKATSSENDPVPINTKVAGSNVLFHLFFGTVRLIGLYKVIYDSFIILIDFWSKDC